MKLLISLLFTFACVLGCKDKKEDTVTGISAETTNSGPGDDSTAIRTTITNFYNWYNVNYTKLMDYQLYSSVKKNDAPPYRINWEEVNRYQQFIRDSIPQLGQEFLADQKIFLQQCDSAFKIDVEDDIPYGFDYDWYTNSQEDPQYIVGQVKENGPWQMAITGDVAIVEIKGFNDHRGKQERATILTIRMKKENDKWTIAKIAG